MDGKFEKSRNFKFWNPLTEEEKRGLGYPLDDPQPEDLFGDDDDDALIEKEYQRLEMKAKSKVLKVKQMQRKKEKLIEKSAENFELSKDFFNRALDLYPNFEEAKLKLDLTDSKLFQKYTSNASQ